MKKLLLSLSTAAFWLSTAYGQSVWVSVPGAPIYDTDVSFYFNARGSSSLFSPQPGVVWGMLPNGYPTGASGIHTSSSKRTIIWTPDNGQTWQTRPIRSYYDVYSQNSSGSTLIDYDFQGAQSAWLLEAAINSNSSLTPALLRTTTGVAGFAPVVAALPANLNKIHFFTSTIGVGATITSSGNTATSTIYRTTDGGATWAAVTTLATGTYVAYKDYQQNSLWFGLSSGTTSTGYALRTLDAGLTWTTVMAPRRMAFENNLQGLAFQYLNGALQLVRTSDGGLTWAVTNASQPAVNNVSAVPGLSGTYIGASYSYSASYAPVGTTYISRDRGDSWQVLAVDAVALDCVVASSSTQLWASTQEDTNTRQMMRRYAGTALPTQQPAFLKQELLAYPNPTTGLVELAGPLQGTRMARVYDATGRLCLESQVSEVHRQVDLSAQPAGLYQVVLPAADGSLYRQQVAVVH